MKQLFKTLKKVKIFSNILIVVGIYSLIFGNLPSFKQTLESNKKDKLRSEFIETRKNGATEDIDILINKLMVYEQDFKDEINFLFLLRHSKENDWNNYAYPDRFLNSMSPTEELFLPAIRLVFGYVHEHLDGKAQHNKIADLISRLENNYLTYSMYHFLRYYKIRNGGFNEIWFEFSYLTEVFTKFDFVNPCNFTCQNVNDFAFQEECVIAMIQYVTYNKLLSFSIQDENSKRIRRNIYDYLLKLVQLSDEKINYLIRGFEIVGLDVDLMTEKERLKDWKKYITTANQQ